MSPTNGQEPGGAKTHSFPTSALDAAISPIAMGELDGRLTYANRAFVALLGCQDLQQAFDRLSWEVCLDREAAKAAVAALRGQGSWEGALGIRREDGTPIEVQLAANLINDASGQPRSWIVSCTEITERKRTEAILEARLRLVGLAGSHTLDELLVQTLDEAEALTGSQIGFLHFVGADQKTLLLQAWSTRTTQVMCRATGRGQHYPIDQAGVWVDCIRERRPVVHNDYPALKNKKGLPAGHAPVLRELLVPVFRDDKIVALLGVGNKPSEYNQSDVETVSRLGDLAWDIAERKRAEEVLRHNERFLRESQRAGRVGSYELDLNGEAWTGTEIAYEILGVTPDSPRSTQQWLGLIHAEEAPVVKESLRAHFAGEAPALELEYRIRCPSNGEVRWVHHLGRLLVGEAGRPARSVGTVQDISRRKRAEADRALLEDELLQAQKMEAVGRLAGGVAHDFNNILAAMMLQLNLLRVDLDLTPDGLREAVDELLGAATRAANLTRQLLLFSRRQSMRRARHDLNEVVAELSKLLHRLIGEDIRLEVARHPAPVWFDGDAGMLEQVVMNLCVNARDAMPEGGQLTIMVSKVVASSLASGRHSLAVGDSFACLAVSDTGCGIGPEIIDHIFEPFFTTKPQGSGTGLGLATVHGIVTKHGGWVEVDSQLGKGSTFTVYLPSAEGAPAKLERTSSGAPRGGQERVLLVEDEESVRRMVVISLRRLGYQVTEAASGVEALRIWQRQGGQFDLLLTDMVMPEGINGFDLALRLKALNPGLCAVIASGYSGEAVHAADFAAHGVDYLPKPYDHKTLAVALRSCLDRRG